MIPECLTSIISTGDGMVTVTDISALMSLIRLEELSMIQVLTIINIILIMVFNCNASILHQNKLVVI